VAYRYHTTWGDWGMDDISAQAVRIDAEGNITLRPYIDFRAPGCECPQPPAIVAKVTTAPVAPQRIPDFLLRRLPSLAHLKGGRA
jgi:hypothetical protein